MTLPDRLTAETELARRLAQAQRENLRLVKEALGDTVDPNALTFALFEALGQSYSRALAPYLEQLFVDSANHTAHGLVDTEYDKLLTLGSQWAQEYVYILFGNIVDTDRRLLQDAVSGFHQNKLNKTDWNTALSRIFSPVRAEIIAITETTRAEIEGDRAYVRLLAAMGYVVTGLVITMDDERTCLVCGAKHKQPVLQVGYPPFHPRCRCMVSYYYEVTR